MVGILPHDHAARIEHLLLSKPHLTPFPCLLCPLSPPPQLSAYGYTLVGDADKDSAHLWLLNTCTVKVRGGGIRAHGIRYVYGRGFGGLPVSTPPLSLTCPRPLHVADRLLAPFCPPPGPSQSRHQQKTRPVPGPAPPEPEPGCGRHPHRARTGREAPRRHRRLRAAGGCTCTCTCGGCRTRGVHVTWAIIITSPRCCTCAMPPQLGGRAERPCWGGAERCCCCRLSAGRASTLLS